MQKKLSACLLSFVASTTAPAFAEQINAHVVGVADGDTIKILTADMRPQTIRLNGIDCPEKRQEFGDSAKQFTSKLVFNKDVILDEHGHDRYGRIIAEVLLPDGTDVNYALVQNGYAWWYRKYSHDEQLQKLETQAREQHIGLWKDPNPVAPWDFRKQRKTKQSPAP